MTYLTPQMSEQAQQLEKEQVELQHTEEEESVEEEEEEHLRVCERSKANLEQYDWIINTLDELEGHNEELNVRTRQLLLQMQKKETEEKDDIAEDELEGHNEETNLLPRKDLLLKINNKKLEAKNKKLEAKNKKLEERVKELEAENKELKTKITELEMQLEQQTMPKNKRWLEKKEYDHYPFLQHLLELDDNHIYYDRVIKKWRSAKREILMSEDEQFTKLNNTRFTSIDSMIEKLSEYLEYYPNVTLIEVKQILEEIRLEVSTK